MVVNPLVRWVLDSPLHGVLSGSTLLLHYVGRRSGQGYVIPVNYVLRGDTFWIMSLRARQWWKNLRGGAAVQLTVRGELVCAEAGVVDDVVAVAEELTCLFNFVPKLARFYRVRRMADGHFDVMRLAEIARDMVVVRCTPMVDGNAAFSEQDRRKVVA